MQPLRDYLNESPLQYEGILDPNQDQVMNRMTDDMICQRIREYCTYKRHSLSMMWPAADYDLQITKVDKDEKGWYIETKSALVMRVIYGTMAKSFYDYCRAKGQKIDKQKGFLIKDLSIYFRWRKHHGILEIGGTPNLESTQGLPEELEQLHLYKCCQKSKKFDVCNKINVISLAYAGDIKITGNGCKNILINSNYPCGNITAPNGVKIYRPKDPDEYSDLRKKIVGY